MFTREKFPAPTRLVQLTLAVALSLLSGGTTRASQVRPVNLEELTQHAATIFAGRCAGVTTQFDPLLGAEVTMATFDVDQMIKGERAPTLTVKLLGATADGPAMTVAGMPTFRPGEKVVLFLYRESVLGFTSPVALGQGRFQIVEDKNGRKLAINGTGNRTLFHGLSSDATRRLDSQRARGGANSVLETNALIRMIQTLKD